VLAYMRKNTNAFILYMPDNSTRAGRLRVQLKLASLPFGRPRRKKQIKLCQSNQWNDKKL
jgi:hypothetical protein